MINLLCLDSGSDIIEREPRVVISHSYTAPSHEEILLEQLGRKQAEAMRLLGELAELRPNWDSYGSQPPTAIAINKVMDVLLHVDDRSLPSTPRVVPVSGGGVQLEWRTSSRELHLEIGPEGTAEYLQIEIGQAPKEEEIPSPTTDQLVRLVAWLNPTRHSRAA